MSSATSIINSGRPCRSNPRILTRITRRSCCRSLRKTSSLLRDRAAVEQQIREVLIQRGISDLTAKWLDDTKSRLKIEIEKAGAKP